MRFGGLKGWISPLKFTAAFFFNFQTPFFAIPPLFPYLCSRLKKTFYKTFN